MVSIPSPHAPHVTGMAWSTPLGTELDKVWCQLLEGASGVGPTPSSYPLRTRLTATVPSLPLDEAPDQRQLTLAVRTLQAAFADAGLAPENSAVTLVLGTSYGGHLDIPFTSSLEWWARSSAERVGHPHRPITVTTACSAGADSILLGAELIRSGHSEICVCGGVDVVTSAKRLGHSALGTMSSHGLRAFDEDHDGMVLGEGAAFLVLESAASAHARKARVWALLSGTGSSNDAAGMTAPDPSGESVVLAVSRCLVGSGFGAADVAVVSAHGSGTTVNDAVEATSLTTLFSGTDLGPVVFGTKGALGHSLGATGAIEAITVIMALRDCTVPPIHGLRSPVPDLSLRLPIGRPLSFSGDAGISLTLGFGGFNTCLLFTNTRVDHE